MKRALVALVLCACASDPLPERTVLPPVALRLLTDGVWLHTSYKEVPPWGPIRTNGLVVEARGGVWLIDTAWTDEQTADVLALTRARTGHVVTHAVLTHAHDDKMGGVDALHAEGVATYAHPLSNGLAPARGLTPAEHDVVVDVAGDIALPAGTPDGISVFYPGPAHTHDNLIVGVPGSGVLFGGCMIRPGDAKDLGNTADGDVASWAGSVRSVAARFPGSVTIVPSHGEPGERRLLDHTLALAEHAASTEPDSPREESQPRAGRSRQTRVPHRAP